LTSQKERLLANSRKHKSARDEEKKKIKDILLNGIVLEMDSLEDFGTRENEDFTVQNTVYYICGYLAHKFRNSKLPCHECFTSLQAGPDFFPHDVTAATLTEEKTKG
jgi:hypothetical protein